MAKTTNKNTGTVGETGGKLDPIEIGKIKPISKRLKYRNMDKVCIVKQKKVNKLSKGTKDREIVTVLNEDLKTDVTLSKGTWLYTYNQKKDIWELFMLDEDFDGKGKLKNAAKIRLSEEVKTDKEEIIELPIEEEPVKEIIKK